jgi:hypothetical protein
MIIRVSNQSEVFINNQGSHSSVMAALTNLNMSKLLFKFVVIVIFGFSCSDPKKNNENVEIIAINDANYKEEIPLSAFVNKIRIMPLETTSTSFIVEVTKLIETENAIYILDRPGKRILKFAKDGKFISQIGREGKGPGEYITPFDVEVLDNEIFVLDFSSRKLKSYDSEKLNYNYEINSPEGALEISVIGGKLIFYCMSDSKDAPSYFVMCNMNGSMPTKLAESRYSQSSIKLLGSTIFCGNGLISRLFESVIYQIDNNRFSAKFNIDFGDREMPEIKTITNQKVINKDFAYYYRYKTYNCQRFLIFDFLGYKKRLYCFYDKDDKRTIWGKIKNDVRYDSFLPFYPRFSAFNSLIGAFSPEVFINNKNNEEITELKSLKFTDNPVLVYYDL